jgi:glycerol-3-phosphate dehydrogenase (NAD(P)+)
VELCAALKNVIAIAAGICDGLKLGDNAKAALITRGLAEIRRLGERMGAYPFTFMGLAGVGDLITTCTSPHSRNRAFGELLSKGFSPFDAERSISQTVEGIKTALAAKRLADHFCVELPICQKVYEVIYCGGKVEEAVSALMQRPWKKEEAQIMMQGGGLNDKS